MRDLLFIDTETGGLFPQTDALLSIGLAKWSDGHIVETREILVQPDHLNVSPSALAVNRINMAKHIKHALSRRDAAELLVRTVNEWFHYAQDKVVLAGHNVAFDVNFTRPLLGKVWPRVFLHRTVDTSALLQYLSHAQRMPDLQSLDQALKYFNIEIESSKRHTALGDAVATAQLYDALLLAVSKVSGPVVYELGNVETLVIK